MKKIYIALILILIFIVLLVVVTTIFGSKHTVAGQQACIKAAVDRKVAAINTSAGVAADNASIKEALKTKQDAIDAAQKIKDPVARTAQLQAAMNAYNNNEAVKKARTSSATVAKETNDKYISDAKACLQKSFFQKISDNISSFFSNLFGFLLKK